MGGLGCKPDKVGYLRLLRKDPAITEVRYIDSAGKEQLHVSRLGIDREKSGADFSNNPVFLEAKRGKTWFSPVYFRKGSEPYMTIAMTGPRKRSGVTMADVNLKFVWEVVNRIKVGKADGAYVVGSEGKLIAHTNISLVLKKTDLSSLPQVAAARESSLNPDREEVSVSQDLQDRQVLTTYAPISPLG